MKLLLVRHAIAEDRGTFASGGQPDDRRPLTDEGRRKFGKGAEALGGLLPELALVATSPFARAKETAEILVRAYERRPVLSERAELAPDGSTAAVLRFVAAQKALAAVALVGHEPDLSMLAGFLLVGKERPLLELRKGGAALFDFPGRIAAGAARLLWLLPPALLRELR